MSNGIHVQVVHPDIEYECDGGAEPGQPHKIKKIGSLRAINLIKNK